MDRFFFLGIKNFIAVLIINFIIILLEITCYLCHRYVLIGYHSYLIFFEITIKITTLL